MRHRLLLPFVLTAALAPLPAQERWFGGALLVHYGAGDLVPNQPLIEALLNEAELATQLSQLDIDADHGVRATAELPAAHLPGTCQIHLGCTVAAATWTPEKERRAFDITADHLQQRLSFLLFEQPHAELQARADSLSQRCRDLATARSLQLQRRDAATAKAEALTHQVQQLDDMLLTARIESTTEADARSQLGQLADRHRKDRDDVATSLARLAAQVRDLEAKAQQAKMELEVLRKKVATGGDPTALRADIDRMTNEIAQTQDQLAVLRGEQDQRQAVAQDTQRLLTATLEQIPITMLALQRARARVASIQEPRDKLAAELAAAQKERAAAQTEVDSAEQASIDLAVYRSLLSEVQGKLARLEPVRVERLR